MRRCQPEEDSDYFRLRLHWCPTSASMRSLLAMKEDKIIKDIKDSWSLEGTT